MDNGIQGAMSRIQEIQERIQEIQQMGKGKLSASKDSSEVLPQSSGTEDFRLLLQEAQSILKDSDLESEENPLLNLLSDEGPASSLNSGELAAVQRAVEAYRKSR